MKTTSQIYCKFDIEGTHCWSDCPHDDVSYLQHNHRHIFKFVVYMNVDHQNRDVEFIRLGHELKKHLVSKFWDDRLNLCVFGYKSCEMLAQMIIEYLIFNYSEHPITVDVSEDGENGGIVTFTPPNIHEENQRSYGNNTYTFNM